MLITCFFYFKGNKFKKETFSKKKMNRKDFLKNSAALCSIALIPSSIIQSCKKEDYSGPSNVNLNLDLSLAENATLNNVGGYRVVNGLLVMRISITDFSALSATCTHEGCSLNYSNTQSKVLCPCHGASFNAISGAVLGGPAHSALTKYTCTLTGNILNVKSQ